MRLASTLVMRFIRFGGCFMGAGKDLPHRCDDVRSSSSHGLRRASTRLPPCFCLRLANTAPMLELSQRVMGAECRRELQEAEQPGWGGGPSSPFLLRHTENGAISGVPEDRHPAPFANSPTARASRLMSGEKQRGCLRLPHSPATNIALCLARASPHADPELIGSRHLHPPLIPPRRSRPGPILSSMEFFARGEEQFTILHTMHHNHERDALP
ncbi:hypothetical protein Purlil1_10212 [Purpureocillium lilacinum]|uniref:Uncharacterized protein n=1 Tax=Purpureocillium lilacinum TaxID=33203 RepID=A0ABR0BNA3_PURLI|nr:hypothetical protein Purlil1_10212 [Purpureocillium lilacinum]